MDANQLAQGTLSRLFKRASDKLLAHVSDSDLHKMLSHWMFDRFTDDERQTLIDALRAATTDDEIAHAITHHCTLPAWVHWWDEVIEQWDRVEAEAERERQKLERSRAERSTADQLEFEKKNPLLWSRRASEKLVLVWEGMQAIRRADEFDGNVNEAYIQFFDAIHSDESGFCAGWWRTPTLYYKVEMQRDHLLWMTGRWISEAAQ